MTSGQIRGHLSERALKELSNALFRGAVALLVSAWRYDGTGVATLAFPHCNRRPRASVAICRERLFSERKERAGGGYNMERNGTDD